MFYYTIAFDTENLVATTQTQDKMKGGFLLNVVVTQSSTIFKLFSGKDQTLLIRWDTCNRRNLNKSQTSLGKWQVSNEKFQRPKLNLMPPIPAGKSFYMAF